MNKHRVLPDSFAIHFQPIHMAPDHGLYFHGRHVPPLIPGRCVVFHGGPDQCSRHDGQPGAQIGGMAEKLLFQPVLSPDGRVGLHGEGMVERLFDTGVGRISGCVAGRHRRRRGSVGNKFIKGSDHVEMLLESIDGCEEDNGDATCV